MGCGASKGDVVKSASSDILPKKDNSANSAASQASTIPAHDGEEGYQNGRPIKVLPPLKPLRNLREKPPEPIAFEVPADDDKEIGSLIKKHPPRRLREWEEKSPELNMLTQDDIVEKVSLANQRRSQVLNQRIASARQKSARGRRGRPVMINSEQYNMAELDNELHGWGGDGTGGGADLS